MHTMKKLSILTVIIQIWLFIPTEVGAQNDKWNAPGNGNPIIAGYFADPTIK